MKTYITPIHRYAFRSLQPGILTRVYTRKTEGILERVVADIEWPDGVVDTIAFSDVVQGVYVVTPFLPNPSEIDILSRRDDIESSRVVHFMNDRRI